MKTPLQVWIDEWMSCTKCSLSKTRTQVVHGRGNVPADRLDKCQVMFIGEAPGDSEDITGQPFSGPAGYILDDIIKQSVPQGILYSIANLVGCIPRDEDGHKSGQPDHDEIQACKPRLEKFIRLCDPELIVTVGKLPREYTEQGVRGSVEFHKAIPMVDITHPAAILRMPFLGRGLAVRRAVVTIAKGIENHVQRKES